MKRTLIMLALGVILGMTAWSCETTSDFDEVVMENELDISTFKSTNDDSSQPVKTVPR